MPNITERQKQILALVIRDYIETAQPVSSQRLVDVYELTYSSATVRNEMSALTEMGYLRQPHTSAGRVPSEEGYRYFVGQLMGNTDLPVPTKRMIVHQFYQAGMDIERWMRLAASVLAHQSQAASVVTAPHSDTSVFKHIELISTRGRQVLMVLVMANGEIRQQMLALAEPVTQEQLSQVAQRLNNLYQGLNGESIKTTGKQLEALEQDITKLILEEIRQSTKILGSEVYRDGINHVLGDPEFSEEGGARRALRILEERSLLEDLITRTMLSTEFGGVQVLIGGEGTYEELRDWSVVLARYGHPDLASGTLGVLGPIRMPYGRTISTVRFVANLLSNLVVDLNSE